jgi:hypothetical protein
MGEEEAVALERGKHYCRGGFIPALIASMVLPWRYGTVTG